VNLCRIWIEKTDLNRRDYDVREIGFQNVISERIEKTDLNRRDYDLVLPA